MACLSGSTMRLSENLKMDLSPAWFMRKGVHRSVGVGVSVRERNTKAMAVAKFKGTQMREKQLTEMIEKKVMEAKEVCGEGDPITDECKVAWDEVDEVSQAKADLRLKLQKHDPLESFCLDNPETDECRLYDD